MSENKIYTVEEIMGFIPHRYPFLLVDRLEVEVAGEKGIGLKNVTMNEEFFQGHFPNNPIMPGVLQIEAMAQTAGALVVAANEDAQGGKANVLFMSIDGVKFRKPVKPGDQLKMHVEKIKDRGRIWVFKGECKVDGKVVSEAEFTAMIILEK
ncbi:MAG: 3-hydroxyacyl-ACP dehydratase FabZ [Alphaproteobacteria bacterium]|nr:3-hydroxyacyl-ACP dehydratase FabZ [Alphaproteobacteria bacterium]